MKNSKLKRPITYVRIKKYGRLENCYVRFSKKGYEGLGKELEEYKSIVETPTHFDNLFRENGFYLEEVPKEIRVFRIPTRNNEIWQFNKEISLGLLELKRPKENGDFVFEYIQIFEKHLEEV